MFIDLSHSLENGMPGFRMKSQDGDFVQYTASISPFLTHEASKKYYEEDVSFEITQISFQTSIGTYLDSPYHRYKNARDISKLTLNEVILDGIYIDLKGHAPNEEINIDLTVYDLSGKVVLFNFGWDKFWGTDAYHSYPYISENMIEELIKGNTSLVGVDTINIDHFLKKYRPAHTRLLANDILIVENLCNLSELKDKNFRLFAVPIKVKQAAAMPIRAFAEIL